MLGSAAKMAADVKWCISCEEAGLRNRLRIMQINLDEAALFCESEQCTNTSTTIVPRSVSRLNVIKRKKHRVGVSSPPSIPAESPQSLVSSELTHSYPHNNIPGSTNTGTVPHLKTQLWEGKVMQWQNEDALCWLDVSMCVLVQCSSLRLCLRRLGESSLLHNLCCEFDNAQVAAEMTGHQQRTNHDRLCENELTHSSETSQLKPSQSMQCSEQLSLNNHDGEAALEWLVMSDEESAKQKEQFLAKKAKQQDNSKQDNPPPTAESILKCVRQKLWKALEEKLDCKLGKEETPVFALPLLSRFSGAVQEHFMTRYRWEFFCSVCNHSDITVCTKAMTSFTHLASDFSLLSPVILKVCPVCKSPDQRNHLVYHSLPSCIMYHFSKGAPSSDVNSYNFQTESSTYEVASIIQYTSNPNHFIAWIRDTHRNMWLKCNDLETPVCDWRCDSPIIPSSEIHIVIMEKQGEPCDRCDAMNSDMIRIKGNVEQVVEKKSVMGTNRQVVETTPSVGIAPVQKVSSVNRCEQSALNGRLTHLWQRRASSFSSYSASNKTATASHLDIINLDAENNENGCKSTPKSLDGNSSKEKCGEIKSRSASPSIESFPHKRKRSRPNYLCSVSPRSKSKVKEQRPNNVTSKIYNKETDHVDGGSSKKFDGFMEANAADVKFNTSTVYNKRVRSNRKDTSKRAFYQRKNLYPSYSDSQGQKTSNSQPGPEPTMSRSLPEGAFVRFAVWSRKTSKSDSRNSTSSPNELCLDTKSISQIVKPRCNSLSSVSSPSACSDLSSVSDSMSSTSNSSKDELSSTIDELYKALEIGGATSHVESRFPSPTVDDNFLAQILSDDPVCSGLDKSISYSGISSKSASIGPSIQRTAPSGQELDRIVPSIEPMGQDLLEKLVA